MLGGGDDHEEVGKFLFVELPGVSMPEALGRDLMYIHYHIWYHYKQEGKAGPQPW